MITNYLEKFLTNLLAFFSRYLQSQVNDMHVNFDQNINRNIFFFWQNCSFYSFVIHEKIYLIIFLSARAVKYFIEYVRMEIVNLSDKCHSVSFEYG